LRRQFRELVKAITDKAPAPEPKPSRRKRTDETRGGFVMAARKITRHAVRLPAEAYAATASYLSHTLDWLNPWHHDSSSEPDEDFSHAPQNNLFPQP
jgi:hypothetical protein